MTPLSLPEDVILTGVASLSVVPGAAIAPPRWVNEPARLARMDRLCALSIVASDGALIDASLAPTSPAWRSERTAVVFGTAYGCHATNEEFYRGLLRDGVRGASPRLFAYTLPSSPVGEICIHHQIRGPAATLANGLNAGVDAIVEAAAQIRSQRADRVLVVVADVATALLAHLLNELPCAEGEASPRARHSVAFVRFAHHAPSRVRLRDGAAAFLLERHELAVHRGARTRARVLAAATCRSATGDEAAVHAARIALSTAAIPPRAVTQILGNSADAVALRALGIDAPAAAELGTVLRQRARAHRAHGRQRCGGRGGDGRITYGMNISFSDSAMTSDRVSASSGTVTISKIVNRSR
jgi:3-oxoacyl-(acyl-carrier-protein) synthase